MSRKPFLPGLIVIVSMLLAACGGGTGGTGGTTTGSTTAPEAPTTAAVAAPTTAAEATTAPTTGAAGGATAEATTGAAGGATSEATTGATSGATTEATSGAMTGATSGATTEATSGAMTGATSGATTEATSGAMTGATTEATTSATSGTGTTGAGAGATGMEGLQGKAASISQELADALAGKYKGTKVSVTGPATGEDANKFNAAVKEFADTTGINIQYEGTKEFEATIAARVDGGNPPDIADFPQPGLAASFTSSGKVVDVNKFIKPEWLKQNYNQSYLDLATLAGPNNSKVMAGVWHRAFPKSLVWYPKTAFDQAGYKTPQTWDDLQKLMDQIVADGDTPWCIGIESGAATGWPATDWTEEMMLRTTSLENYDKWVSGDLKFTDPIVKNAVTKWSDIWFNDKYVYGGRKSIVSTNFGDSPTPMFAKPDPKCWLHKQGSFITSFFPKDAKPGVDYDVFYLPPLDPQYGKPVEFSGDLMVAFNDRPEVRAVEAFFSTGASVESWVKAGGATSPHKDSSLDWYTNAVDKNVANILQQAQSLRFDGSDAMPGVVGSGTFFKGMTDYVAGTVNEDQAMEEIQAGWANVKK